ncbi:MAG: pantoate--beta-alanine ligase, partial [Methylococcaceae bacterium]|nr:pantoate--beta-alanine ligase [Methylococcaceae bacterium]
LELVKAAKQNADKVVVSIFVNPTQFGEGEDFESYPRTEQQDSEALAAHKVDVLFLPPVEEIYYPNAKTIITVSGISDLHCGASRKGHFAGVATIVCKLFNMVQPDLAFFGEKDFQQLAVIRLMVRDLNIPVSIESVKIIRETDGLAMSSRNGYLTEAQRLIAPNLYKALCNARDTILEKKIDFAEIEQQQQQTLNKAGFEVDYFSICRTTDLLAANKEDTEIVILAAAKLGKPRLIDNIYFKIPAST